jgi:diguanylate cyclase (GGDEF)-like protein
MKAHMALPRPIDRPQSSAPAARLAKTPVSARLLSSYYITALLIVAGLTIASHLALTLVLDHNQGAAAIINVSGRQRMLSQRIAGLAAEYRLGDATARAPLLAATDEFESNENILADAVLASPEQDAADSQLRQIYATTFANQVNTYIADARLVAGLPPDAPAALPALKNLFAQARAPLLDRLESVVLIHQHSSEAVLTELENLQLIILALVLVTLAAEALTIFRPMINRIEDYTGELARLATIDPLTGLSNRRGFAEKCEAELLRARRSRRPTSLLLLDADHFKKVNDTYGHAAGDEALCLVARTLQSTLRATDITGRIGGEEFTVLLPETDLAGASLLAERLRETIDAAKLTFQDQLIRLTVSIGVAPVGLDAAESPLETALQAADAALYRAKQAGRNRVIAAA